MNIVTLDKGVYNILTQIFKNGPVAMLKFLSKECRSSYYVNYRGVFVSILCKNRNW